MKTQISTPNAPTAPHILSQGLVSGNFIFVSGQIHAKPDNSLVDGSIKEKMDQIMSNISSILKAGGSSLDNIIKVVIYVTDMAILPEINEVYPSYFTKPYPVREAICVKALPLNAEIEISAIATK